MKLLRAGCALLVWGLLLGACSLGTDIDVLRGRVMGGEQDVSDAITYTVVYDKNADDADGTMESSIHTYDVAQALNRNTFTRTNYTFFGWALTADGTAEFTNGQSVVNLSDIEGAMVTLYAVWVDSSTVWTVRFETNGGSPVGDAVLLRNTPVGRPAPDPSRTGYTFVDWFTDEELTSVYNFSSIVMNNITLYAKWTPITYTIVYDKNNADATGTMGNSSHTYDIDKNLNINTFTRTGFALAGWAETPNGAVKYANGENVKNLTSVAGATVTLYAQWNYALPLTSIAYVVPYLATRNGGMSVDDSISLPMQIDLGTMTQTGSGWRQLLDAIEAADKYVHLDLAACTMNGTDFNPDNIVSTGKNRIVEIALPHTAASIAWGDSTSSDSIFKHFTVLKSFSGVGLTSIGSRAFYDCTSLVLTELPSGLAYIRNGAFAGCTSLALTELPEGLTFISADAFSRCTSLALTALPSEITYIGELAFSGCTSLALTELPSEITSIRNGAFYNCTSLALTELPSGLTFIGNSVFYGCTSLALTELPEGLTSIGADAFYGCTNITSMRLLSATNFFDDNNPFMGCTSLVSFTTIGIGPLSVVEDGKVLVMNNTKLVAYPSASGNITLPSGITSIGNYAFYGCTNLALTELPEGLTSIGRRAFYGCTSLALVICHAVTPPDASVGWEQFTESHPSLQIKVPAGSVAAYKAASGWSAYADRISAIGE